MAKIPQSCSPVNAREQMRTSLAEAETYLRRQVEGRLNELLLAIVCHVLGRFHHQRRKRVSWRLQREGRCRRCGTRRSHRFSRNGYRQRQLLTRWDVVSVELPRVRCICGGSVQIDFGNLLRPHQRIWDDVDAQIWRWSAMALSLRQMRKELAQLNISPLALRTLNKRLYQLTELESEYDPDDVPPILQVDAIWVTQLRSNGRVRRDRHGRKRSVKGRFKRPILVAMGVWPDTHHSQIVHWQLCESENAEEWVSFLEVLEAQGICGENGLKLIIHDGGSGLCSALQTVWFDAEQQRCLFHKLRNIYNAIQVSEDLSPKQRRRRRKAIFKDFRAIWEARHYQTVLRRYLKTVRTHRSAQPEAVASLRRDFRSTVTYYDLEQQFPAWNREHLRTTSRLERFNRRLRHRARAASAYHSDQGLLGMIAQEAHATNTLQRDR